ncbi:pullulanase-type alpha-1,6-glucosidase [Photobacterium sp.]|uniref:pullulanase-type alpha-1,6-glucosidase n=1 Tax=Photobacterium sp. TaxID=660 RepID=UPI00299D21B2|nr:pullulanase-type alpha-1,6-glucosidase [Photobacterium sp.]MDX1301546.1 pullulanase-type alpha-1,6-glucosidase [Photobacterium sp.]
MKKSTNKFKYSALAKIIIPLCSAVAVVGCNNSSSDVSPSGGDKGGSESGKLVSISQNQAAIYFKRDSRQVAKSSTADQYEGYTLHIWNDDSCGSYDGENSDWSQGVPLSGVDETLGAYWVIDLKDDDSQCVNFIPRDSELNKPLGDFNAKLDLNQVHNDGNYVFTTEGITSVFPERVPELPENTSRIYINLEGEDYSDLSLHVWNDDTCGSFEGSATDWEAGLPLTGTSKTYGAYWDIATKDDPSQCVNFIPHIGNEKPLLDNTQLDLEKAAAIGNAAFTFEGSSTVYYEPLVKLPSAQFAGASAHWLTSNVLAVEAGAANVELLYSSKGGIEYDSKQQSFSGVEKTISTMKATGNDWSLKFPHLNNLESWTLDFEGADVSPKDILKGQLFTVTYDASGNVLLATQVQSSAAIDDLYAGDAGTADDLAYGAIIGSPDVTFRLWAPTAQSVAVVKYSDDKAVVKTLPMVFDEASGSWSLATSDLQAFDYYRYKINVYHPVAKSIVEYEVTDPYSLSLSMNSEFSQVVDLTDRSLKPAGWDSLARPVTQTNPAEFVIYESHVRDFSALDESTPKAQRGKFTAFTSAESVPVKHLKSLKDNGVTHLHLLPFFDIATINEDPQQVANIDAAFSKLCTVNPNVEKSETFAPYCKSPSTIADVLATVQKTDSASNPVVQELNRYVSETDGFNWGYDPFHYTVPEGSYSTDPDGTQRILELREAVMAVKTNIGMNVVMDVVYNHTNSAGPESRTSVLDKIVPWYYNRLDPVSGNVTNSTCCSNTAPERAMMEKLITDSLVVWSRDYKIDSFRFDLMGHHPLDQIKNSLAAVQKVDKNTYFYGEGWNFGEVENDTRFVQATQKHLGGTGIGSFSDRLRDAVRGGGPFDGGDGLRQNQGFGNGAHVLPNDMSKTSLETALHLADITRLGMAGNLKNFILIDSKGTKKCGDEVDYNGQPAGYAVDPTEIQNYVSKHDNQTFWDNNQYKIAYTVDADTRVRMQAVSLATTLLGQGVPFTHMGAELLRSKSMQRDSYDSGDWYNKVDFTLQDNNWDKGLPRQDKDGSNYDIITKVIDGAGVNAQASPENMAQMVEFYKELANLRQSYSLITLGKGTEVNARVDFHNTGAAQEPGLIVMSIDNGENSGVDIDSSMDGLVIVINASNSVQDIAIDNVSGLTLSPLHTSSLAQGATFTDGKMTVPAWTPAVFVQVRNGQRGAGIPVTTK